MKILMCVYVRAYVMSQAYLNVYKCWYAWV